MRARVGGLRGFATGGRAEIALVVYGCEEGYDEAQGQARAQVQAKAAGTACGANGAAVLWRRLDADLLVVESFEVAFCGAWGGRGRTERGSPRWEG